MAKKTKAAKKKPAAKKKKTYENYHKRLSVTENELVGELPDDLRDAWKSIREFGASLGEQRIYASHNSIMFSRKFCYFFVRPKKTFLEVWMFLPRAVPGLKSMRSSKKAVKHSNLFKLVHPDQVIEPLTDWLREAYEFATP